MYIPEEKLVPCEFKPGFYQVPGFPFSASREGLVYSYHLGKIPDAFFDPKKTEENKYIHVDKYLAHRLVALTFLELPVGVTDEERVINHKNGLKWDNRIENLEWTTFSGNSIHAYSTGLRSDNTYVKTYDVLSGHVQEFYSLWACARRYGVNGARVHGYLNRKFRAVLFLERYLLVYQSEDFPSEEEWKYWELSIQDIDYVAYDTNIRKAWIFSRRSDAYRHAGISHRKQYALMREAKEKCCHEVFYQSWMICAYSRFRHVMLEVIDKRKSREERYTNYKPHKGKCDQGLSDSDVRVNSA